MIQRKVFGGISILWLLSAAVVWALTGNLSSCTDLPSQIYFRPGTAQYLTVDFKNDTTVHSATWSLNFVDSALIFDNSCASGRVSYASEVASHGCSTSDTLSGGTLTVSISGCTTALPTRTDYAALFAVCYKPVGTNADYPGGLNGTCSAHNNSSGDMNCGFSFKETTVADVFMSTSIPATVASNSGQVRAGSFRLGTDELLFSAYFTVESEEDKIEFLDSSNTACCTLLRGGSGGCPNSYPNIIAGAADTTFPAGCSVVTSAMLPGGYGVDIQTQCLNGMTQAGTAAVGIVKFCYRGANTGADTLTGSGTATPYSTSDVLAVHFPSQSVTVTP